MLERWGNRLAWIGMAIAIGRSGGAVVVRDRRGFMVSLTEIVFVRLCTGIGLIGFTVAKAHKMDG